MRSFRLAAHLLVAGPLLLGAQDTGVPVERARTYRISSNALGEERVIDIALPRGYDTGTERYPVIVVLDGESHHEIAAAIARYYASAAMVPPAIVIGVRNTSRTRDLTPPPRAGFTVPPEARAGGGADSFLRFLGDELLPYVDRGWRTTPLRVLVGHSLGGLFALHALAQRPAHFTAYVVMEPSIWWNAEHEWKTAAATLRQPASRRARLMLVNTPLMRADTTQWGGTAPMVRHLSIRGETHVSMAIAGMTLAFRTLFADFRPSEWKPGTRPVAMLERYDSLAERVGYAVPIPASAYERTIRMSVHARHFEDAERMLVRMERAFGVTGSVTNLREMLAAERATPAPAGLIPLVIPAARPTPAQASAFLGRWTIMNDTLGHEIEIRASKDTIVVHSRIQFPDGSWDEGDRHVIQVTPDGTLEWGLPWFRGIAALLVQKARIQSDGSMRVEREPRGWVPRGPGPGMHEVEYFRRIP
jgi:predicted alpha/beta superfamily hydrolase